jgi:hypothetical protein
VMVKGLTALLTVVDSHVRCSKLAPICLDVCFGQSSILFHRLEGSLQQYLRKNIS